MSSRMPELRADTAAATGAPGRQPPAAKKVVSLGEELSAKSCAGRGPKGIRDRKGATSLHDREFPLAALFPAFRGLEAELRAPELVVWRVLLLDPLGELLPQRLEIVLGADALLDLVAAGPDVLNAALVHVLLLLQSEEVRFEVVNLSSDLQLALLPPLIRLFVVEAGVAQSLLVLLSTKQRFVRPGPLHIHDLLLVVQPRELPPHEGRLLDVPRVLHVHEGKSIFLVPEHLRHRPVDVPVVAVLQAVHVAGGLREVLSPAQAGGLQPERSLRRRNLRGNQISVRLARPTHNPVAWIMQIRDAR